MSLGNYGRRTIYRSPTLKVDYEMDRRGMREVAVGHHLREAVTSIVKIKAKPYAEAISPEETGEYARSFVVIEGHAWWAGMRRVAARLMNTSRYAAAQEFGWTEDDGTEHKGSQVLQKTLRHLNKVDLGMPTFPGR